MKEQQIDDFLMGRLEGEELKKMETAILNEPAISEAVERRKLLLKVVDGFGDIEMMKEINNVHQKEMARNERILTKRKWLYPAAALLLTLLAYSIWLWQQPPAPTQLFADYYQAYPFSFAARNNTDLDQTLTKAESAYTAGDYENAKLLFEDYFSKDSTDSKVRLLIGICQLETENNKEALEQFNLLARMDFDRYKEHGIWYAALVHLKNNNPAKAKSLLEIIVRNNRPPFNEKAKEILTDL